MDKLLFIYDELMTKSEQELTKIPLKFVSCGQMQGRLRFVNDTKKRRIYAIPNTGRSTKVIFGGIFLLKDYEFHKHKLHGYYQNSLIYTNKTMQEDFYDLSKTMVRPIEIKSLQALADGAYKSKKPIECEVFVLNQANAKIQNSMKKRYYKCKNVHKTAFVQMVRENFKTK